MRLVGDVDNPRLITNKTKDRPYRADGKMGSERLDELEKDNLCGFIFKKDSPSSGLLPR